MHKPKIRILTLDIETAPLEVYTWGTYKQDIGVEQIKTEWTILSFAAKWSHKKRVIYMDTGGHGRSQVRKDKKLLKGLHALLDEADIVVAHNGQRFDVKKVNARMLAHGLRPYSPIKIIDTLKEAL